MGLARLLPTDRVFLDLEAKDRVSALREVAEKLEDDAGVTADQILDALMERERLGSTAVGDGFAIPHCKCQGLNDIVVAAARLKKPIDFGGKNQNVDFMFVVLSPPDRPAIHLKVLSQIARVLKRKDLGPKLRKARTKEEIVRLIKSALEEESV